MILNGKDVGKKIKKELKEEIAAIEAGDGKVPGLSVLIAGNDSASRVYIKSNEKVAAKLGIKYELVDLGENVTEQDVIDALHKLNDDDSVSGVLVQLPLPDGMNTEEVLSHLAPSKDADCVLPESLGNIMLKRACVYPCTPFGVIKILEHYGVDVAGKDVVVLGRSFIVGKPVAAMLTNLNATVTICHSRTADLEDKMKRADVIVAAIGVPGFVKPEMVKDGAVLVDVGINYIETAEDAEKYCSEEQKKKFEEKGYAITGDIHPSAYSKSSAYTPVPGGTGQTTVAMLMYNTVELYKKGAGQN